MPDGTKAARPIPAPSGAPSLRTAEEADAETTDCPAAVWAAVAVV